MSVYSSGCAVSLVLLAAWMVCWRGHIHWQNRGAIVVFASGIVVSSWLGAIGMAGLLIACSSERRGTWH